MAFGVSGKYLLKTKFGDRDVPLTPSSIQECTIVKDIRKYLPEFKLVMTDSAGLLTHIQPFDKSMSKITFEISKGLESNNVQVFNFDVYRRSPFGVGTTNGIYEIRGLLEVKNLFNQQYVRSFSGTIKSTLESIARENGIYRYDISSSLDTKKVLLQPNWTNAQFLNYHLANLEGASGQTNYKAFVTVVNNEKVFVCKSYEELLKSPLRRKYCFTDGKYEDFLPAYNYEIIDNYKYLGVLGCRQQDYSFFDYSTGQWEEPSVGVERLTSLSEYFAIDGNDNETGLQYNATGRTNAYTQDFSGKINSIYESRVNELVKMWITIDGDESINCGDIVRVMFPQGFNGGNLFSYQYSGDWLIERVVMSFGSKFMTQLLLTRGGVDTDRGTTLIKSTRRRR